MELGFITYVNGNEYDWLNVTLTFIGTPLIGITKIDYDYSQEMKNNYGASSQPISPGFGRVTYKASMEVYLSTFRAIQAAAGNAGKTAARPAAGQ